MDIETEVRDIKQHVIEISRKVDELLYERELTAMTKLSEKSLQEFFENEPDIYKVEDLKLIVPVQTYRGRCFDNKGAGWLQKHRVEGQFGHKD